MRRWSAIIFCSLPLQIACFKEMKSSNLFISHVFSRTPGMSPYRKLWSVSIPTSLLQHSATGVVIGFLKVIRLDLTSIITFWFPSMRSFISRSDTSNCMESNIIWPDTSSKCSSLKLNVLWVSMCLVTLWCRITYGSSDWSLHDVS